jgi:hypothetical protein
LHKSKVQGSTGKYREVQGSTGKYREVQGSTGKYREVQESTGKYREVQESTGKYREKSQKKKNRSLIHVTKVFRDRKVLLIRLLKHISITGVRIIYCKLKQSLSKSNAAFQERFLRPSR